MKADKAHIHLISGGERTLCCGRKLSGARYTDLPDSVTCPVGLDEALENVSVSASTPDDGPADARTLGHRVQALTMQGHVHAEGTVFSYVDAPTVGLTTDDGERITWRADLIRDLGPSPLSASASADYTSPADLREVPRYTLDEARDLLAREECDREGHALGDHLLRNAGQTVVIHTIVCDRCNATFSEDGRPQGPLTALVVQTTDPDFRVLNPEVLNGAGVLRLPEGVEYRGWEQ